MTLEEFAEEMRAGFAQVNERLDDLDSKTVGRRFPLMVPFFYPRDAQKVLRFSVRWYAVSG